MSHSKFDTVLAHKPSQNLAMWNPSLPQCKCHFGVEPAVALGFAARHSLAAHTIDDVVDDVVDLEALSAGVIVNPGFSAEPQALQVPSR